MIGLAYVRQIKGLSLENVATMIGVTKQTVSKWEHNIIPISQASLKKLSEKLRIEEYILVKEVDNILRRIVLKKEIELYSSTN